METYFYNLLYEHEDNHWWYWVRRKLVHKLIKLYGLSSGNASFLDVGCGTGKLAEELQKYGKVIAIDKSEEAIKFCKQRGIDAEESSIEDYNPGKQFDCIIALDILEHCQNDKMVINKIYDLLKAGGVVIVFVPALKCFWGKQDIISHHFRRYSYKELRDKFKNAGFKTLAQSYFNFFLSLPIFFIRKITNLRNTQLESEFQFNNPLMNTICKFIFNLEVYLLPKIKFPFGVSLLGVYKKEAII